jgi:hypothetical protein
MAKNGSGLTAHWRSLVGEFRWPLGGMLLLILIISANDWMQTPDEPPYVSLWATRFDLLPLGREELGALPVSVRGILLHSGPPEISVSDFAEGREARKVRTQAAAIQWIGTCAAIPETLRGGAHSHEGDDSRSGASGCAHKSSTHGPSCSSDLGRRHSRSKYQCRDCRGLRPDPPGTAPSVGVSTK